MDIIQQAIEGMGKFLAKALTGKESKHEIIIEQKQSSSTYAAILHAMVSDGRINEAENLLFSLIESKNDYDLYFVGLDFYKRLTQLSDEQLSEGGFTRGEIGQGLIDLAAAIGAANAGEGESEGEPTKDEVLNCVAQLNNDSNDETSEELDLDGKVFMVDIEDDFYE